MSPALWTSADLAAALHIQGPANIHANGISIDTRTLQSGDVFIALKGDNFDGNNFIETAFHHGAAAAITSHTPYANDKRPVFHVADTTHALEQLGRYARARARAKIIALTGSVGKTTTKEMLAQALGAQGTTHATIGNLNNHWGLPLTLARMPQDCAYAVLEMGMNHSGEITLLSKLARPQIALITTIDAVHLGNFGSLDDIAAAKAEIFDGLDSDGIVILPRDNAYYNYLNTAAQRRGIKHIYGFGTTPDANARIVNCDNAADYSIVTARIMDEQVTYRLAIPGMHIVKNSLAVLLAVKLAGANLQAAADALAAMPPVTGRGVRQTIQLANGTATLIDESYNASPVSIAAALAVLGNLQPQSQGRRIAVLGDMLELGGQSAALHLGLLPHIIDNKIDLVFACGPHMHALYQQLPTSLQGAYQPSSMALASELSTRINPDDIIMVKGSLGSNMKVIIKDIQKKNDHGLKNAV